MMRQHHNTPTSHDRHDDDEFTNSSLQLSDVAPTAPTRRLRAPLWKKLRGVCVLLGLLGFLEIGVASLTSSHFNVTGIRLEGLSATPVVPVEKVSQELVGQNWFLADSSSVIQSIQKIPTVDSVHVRRVVTWPPQLKVIVQERQPIAIVGAGDHWWKVDSKGVPFQAVSQPEATNFELITGPVFQVQLGKPFAQAQWEPVMNLLDAIRVDQDSKNFQWKLRRIYFDRNGNASLRLSDVPHQELLLQLGKDQWAAKLKRARLALAYLDKTGQRAKVLNFVSYKIPTWIPLEPVTASSDDSDVPSSA